MAEDLLSIIGTSLRQLAAWLGVDVDILLIGLFALAVISVFVLFLIVFLIIRLKTQARAPTAEPRAKEPVTMDYIEKSVMEFPSGKVQIDANVDRLVFKLMEAQPKVVEKIVEVPAKEKPPVLEPVNIEGATDLNAAIGLLCKKYSLESLTISDDKSNVVSSNSKDSKADADLATALAPAGWDVKRVEVRGKPSVYLFPFSKGDRKLLMLFRGAEKDQKVLDLLPKDLGLLGKFL